MSEFESVLNARAGFLLSALVVSWIAIVFLALVAANLHFRLAHLEQSAPEQPGRGLFEHLHGRSVGELFGEEAIGNEHPYLSFVLVLSDSCSSCDRMLDWLRHRPDQDRAAIMWRDRTPTSLPPLPDNTFVVHDGPDIARTLGIRVSPFAMIVGPDGRIVKAAPAGSADALQKMLAAVLAPQPLKGASL